MGFKVGMPMLGLKMSNSAVSGKHAGSLRAIALEEGTERASATKTFDPEKSYLNQHLGPYSSGEEADAAIRAEVKAYSDAQVAEGKRKVRNDATVAWALIVKPDSEWMNQQDEETQNRFLDDSFKVLCDLKIFRPEDVRMRERHADEFALHDHILGMAYDKNGRLAGSRVVNVKTFGKLNSEFPKRMRALGWDVDDCAVYDPQEVKNIEDDATLTEEQKAEKIQAYKDECNEKKNEKPHGLSANDYMEWKEAQKKKDAALEKAEKANELRKDIESEIAELEPKRKHANERIKKAVEATKKWNAAAAEAKAEQAQAAAQKDEADAAMQKVYVAHDKLRDLMGEEYDESEYDEAAFDRAVNFSQGLLDWEDELKERQGEVEVREAKIDNKERAVARKLEAADGMYEAAELSYNEAQEAAQKGLLDNVCDWLDSNAPKGVGAWVRKGIDAVKGGWTKRQQELAARRAQVQADLEEINSHGNSGMGMRD